MTETDKKQIEEMAIVMCEDCADYGDCKYNVCDCVRESASTLYKAGYRKQIKAKWKSGNKNGQYGYYCTNCDACFTGENAEWIAKEHYYCPKCGAIMEEEE